MSGPFGDTTVPIKYQPMILAASARYGVPAAFLAAQINAESGFNPTAVSPAGAVGIAQFLPSTAASVGVDPWNPNDAINGMAKLMAHYKSEFGTWQRALYAYHDGPGAVDHPGPAGIQYAKEILSVSAVSNDTSVTPTIPTSNPLSAIENFFKVLGDPETWKRIGYALLGLFLITVGVFYLFGREALNTAVPIPKTKAK